MSEKGLCLALMHADTEDEVVRILADAGYWSNDAAWRLLGDNENNFSTVGNQQADAIGALAEKIVNSIDARLINAALEFGVAPQGPNAPKSIREAVSSFIEMNKNYDHDRHGLIRNWTPKEIREHADLITVAATGSKPRNGTNPCLTIVDQGEGQSPGKFPDTFMSLQRSNKLRIPFVQGKFNMGGTGALQFCSPKFNLQLIVSRRNPKLEPNNSSVLNQSNNSWGFSVVRRKPPSRYLRSSVYEYLAPVDTNDANDKRKDVLSFEAESMPLFPLGGHGRAYARNSMYGSLVKLYEYNWHGDKSDITRSSTGARQGLLRRLENKLADPALPFRLYECRDYNKRAPYHNGIGIVNAVANKKDDLDVMDGADLSVVGHSLPMRIYLFKLEDDSTQRRASSGVLFLVNGQTHASMSTRFFDRRNVGKSYLKNDLLVTVDCSEIDGRKREDLFMNSRDRLRRGDLASQLENELESSLKSNAKLRNANHQRRRRALRSSMSSNEAVSKVLRDLFRNDHDLARYLIEGNTLGSTSAPAGKLIEYRGNHYPTFVRFKQTSSYEYRRLTDIGSRVSVSLESDADSGYFDRVNSPGRWRIEDNTGKNVSGSWRRTGPDYGQINFTTKLPDDDLPGTLLSYTLIVDDDAPNRTEPFKNRLILELATPNNGQSGSNKSEHKRRYSRYTPPSWQSVGEQDWKTHGFGKHSALKIVAIDTDKKKSYDYYVNVDNIYLRRHSGKPGDDLEANRLLFGNALVLVGLALIRGYDERVRPRASGDEESMDIEDYVSHTTSGMSAVLLPLLKDFVTDSTEATD